MDSHHPGFAECDAYLFDSFEVSVRLRMLSQDGERLKIQELPFHMLLVLLETPGEVVSKKELGNRLWGKDTFVEVDKSLYVLAGKLRGALGDNASQPRFIKNISGRGYCFIGEAMPVFPLPQKRQPIWTPPAAFPKAWNPAEYIRKLRWKLW